MVQEHTILENTNNASNLRWINWSICDTYRVQDFEVWAGLDEGENRSEVRWRKEAVFQFKNFTVDQNVALDD